MKRDAGVTEIVGAVILLALTVAGAAIVMSLFLTPPERAIPTLDYYGCSPDGNTRCIVHQGGATLYSGQYYFNGLDQNQELVPGLVWDVNRDFTLEDRICTYSVGSTDVSFIQLIIIDESGHSLHGTIPTAGLCTSGIAASESIKFGDQCTPSTHPYAGGAAVHFDPITCTWVCNNGSGLPRDDECVWT